MSVAKVDLPLDVRRSGRRFGYGVAVAINVGILVAVQYILEWGWLPFLTGEFADLVPWISLGLAVTIVANVVYGFNDAPGKSAGQILANLISILVTYQIYLVFPFDFSGSTFNWDVVVRVLLVLAMVGAGIGVLTEAITLAASESQQEGR